MSVTTVTIDPSTIQAVALVGRIVTVHGHDGQFRVHSVEGHDFYAFDDDDLTTVDFSMTPVEWITVPVLTVLPSGTKIGEGRSVTVEITKVRRGVNLFK